MIPDFLPDQHYLVLRKWHAINKAMEFRCFVKDNELIAISQRDITAYYEAIEDNRHIIREKAKGLFIFKM